MKKGLILALVIGMGLFSACSGSPTPKVKGNVKCTIIGNTKYGTVYRFYDKGNYVYVWAADNTSRASIAVK